MPTYELMANMQNVTMQVDDDQGLPGPVQGSTVNSTDNSWASGSGNDVFSDSWLHWDLLLGDFENPALFDA